MSRLNPPGISLQPGETLLWQGAPDGNVRFFREDRRALLRRLPLLVFLVPLVSMYDWFPLHLFLIAPFIGAVKSGWELVMYLGELLFMLVFYQFPVLFAAVGLHAMAGHIAYKRSYARRARYYLTDRRVVLALAQKGAGTNISWACGIASASARGGGGRQIVCARKALLAVRRNAVPARRKVRGAHCAAPTSQRYSSPPPSALMSLSNTHPLSCVA